jgi:MFS family permease
MSGRILFWAITSALAGFLFGFDTVVISGAEQKIQSLWGLSSGMHGIALGSALYGTVLGSLIGGWPTDRWGRKPTLLWIGVLYVISAIGCGFAPEIYTFIASRFMGGVGIGISTVAAPLYISEIAPAAHRGRLAGMFQFNIVFGIVVAFASNALLSGVGEYAWRWMLGIAAVPSVAYLFMCFGIPESPRWLIGRKGDRAAGVKVLRLINPGFSDAQINEAADRIADSSGGKSEGGSIWTWRLRIPVVLAFLVAFFNQLSGINAILYFAPRIFGLTGSENVFAQSVGIGLTNLAFTYVGLWLIDRLGRRTLLLIGSFGYIFSLGLCAWAFIHWEPQFRAAAKAVEVRALADQFKKTDSSRRTALARELADAQKQLTDASSKEGSGISPVHWEADLGLDEIKAVAGAALNGASKATGPGGMIVLACIFAFIAAHAVGQGTVIWVLISEIFPNQNRAGGQALGSFTHWIFAALLTTFFPKMVEAFAPGYVFLFFCGMMVLHLIWVKVMVPETKGATLEQIQKRLGIEPE